MITFNDCSTKLYVFRMQMGFEGVALLTAGNLTRMEGRKTERFEWTITKILSRGLSGSFIMHATNSSWLMGEGSTKTGDWAINIRGRFMGLHVPGKTPNAPRSVLNTSTTQRTNATPYHRTVGNNNPATGH